MDSVRNVNVKVIRAKDLKREDGILGKNDPYVELSIGHRLMGGQKYKTATQKNSSGEVLFDENFTFHDLSKESKLKVKVFDDDLVSDDDIGHTTIPLETLFEQGMVHQWYQIGEGSKFRGEVELSLTLV
jgi:Ca2+-dependent lipid-binding protein